MTVLMAVHNGEPFVSETLRSVIDQTFSDFELVVVDDASTDRTVEIVEGFDDPRVRVLRNEHNVGQVPSLNRGLREAVGEYVARIDADDVCLPERLAQQVELLDAQPNVCLVGAWMQAIDERGRRLARLEKTLADRVDFIYHTLIMRVYVAHPAAMYRREPVLALGGYDETTGPSEDKDLWRKLLLEGCDARIVPEILVLYRLHDEQLSQVRANYQRSIDGASQDRFLDQLAPSAPVTQVRQLLAGDAGAWKHDAGTMLVGVELVLDGARTRLSLDDAESARLRERVLVRLLGVASVRPWTGTARAVARYAIGNLPPEGRGTARRKRLAALATAPALSAGRRVVRQAAALAPAGARRAPWARRLYGKAIGTE
ncbi:MAG: glycosyltransferase family 2 protein [Actinobacteria bacterium]|nr:glycosyltransferase family 2 protein [Actinomycetota bacterium]